MILNIFHCYIKKKLKKPTSVLANILALATVNIATVFIKFVGIFFLVTVSYQVFSWVYFVS